MEFMENFREIDITDKTILQEQINFFRKQYYDCLEKIEELEKKIIEEREKIISITMEIYSDPELTPTAANNKLKRDEDYVNTQFNITCYEKTIDILNEKINFIKSDIRILTNSMYNKF